jgi:hypothetical protein
VELPDVADHVVGRKDDHRGVGVAVGQRGGGVGDAGGRVAADRLGENVLVGHGRQLLLRLLDVALVGDHQAALRRNEPLQAGDGVLDEGALPENVEELLGPLLATGGPEATADAPGHDHGVVHTEDGSNREEDGRALIQHKRPGEKLHPIVGAAGRGAR